MNEEEKDEYFAKKGEADPAIDRYRTLNEDAPVAGLEFAWLSKVVGDILPYNQLPPKDDPVTYSFNVLKSLR